MHELRQPIGLVVAVVAGDHIPGPGNIRVTRDLRELLQTPLAIVTLLSGTVLVEHSRSQWTG
jgi:hypothetical protein